jgi:monoamine oxidase
MVSNRNVIHYLSACHFIVKRRKAIKQLGLGLSAGLMMPQWLSSCKAENNGPQIKYNGKVAVIGAGAAGLYAADILRSKGIDVFILEASNRFGGRIRSFGTSYRQFNLNSDSLYYPYYSDPAFLADPSIADFPVELGADILMGSDSSWGKIVSVLQIPTVDLADANNLYVLDNQPKSKTDWQTDNDYNAVQNFVSSIPTYAGNDVTIQNAAGVSTRGQALLNGQLSNFYGSYNEQLATKGLAEELKLITHDKKMFTVKANPWENIVGGRFSESVNRVQYNTPIASINAENDPIIITDKNGKQYTANKVIVTVPLAVLKAGDISFSPPLPSAMQSAMTRIGMDACVRMLIDFKKNFWGESTGFIWGGGTIPQYFSSGYNRSQFYRSMALTVNGTSAQALSSLGSGMIQQVINELDLLFPGATNEPGMATQFIRRVVNTSDPKNPVELEPIAIIQDWTKDQYIKGGISFPLVGFTHQDRVDLATAIPNKVFFAGEATDVKGEAGTVSGALNSAERATAELIKTITG